MHTDSAQSVSKPAYLIDPPQSGPINMAADWKWLQHAESSASPLTMVRFYGWDSPTISLGKHQTPARAVNLEYCRCRQIPIVHRPTGGRAVLHDRELTYAIVSNDRLLFPFTGISETYSFAAQILADGLAQIGVEVQVASRTHEFTQSLHDKPCFASTTRHELLHRTRKIAGSAQRRLKRSFLQHGSIPLEIDYHLMSRVLGVEEQLLRTQMTSVSEAAKRTVEFGELAEVLKSAFETRLEQATFR
jgi:lipoate-protein ligase A